MSYYDDVAKFNQKFGLPVAKACGGERHINPLDFFAYQYRTRFLNEELAEFHKAREKGDLPGMADALVDLVYVALGTAHYMGLPFDELWQEVQRANMAKVLAPRDDMDHKRGAAERIRKPEGWQPPDLRRILQTHLVADRDAAARDTQPSFE